MLVEKGSAKMSNVYTEMEKIASKNSLNLINGPQGCRYRMSTYTNELYFHTLAVNIVKMKLYI